MVATTHTTRCSWCPRAGDLGLQDCKSASKHTSIKGLIGAHGRVLCEAPTQPPCLTHVALHMHMHRLLTSFFPSLLFFRFSLDLLRFLPVHKQHIHTIAVRNRGRPMAGRQKPSKPHLRAQDVAKPALCTGLSQWAGFGPQQVLKEPVVQVSPPSMNMYYQRIPAAACTYLSWHSTSMQPSSLATAPCSSVLHSTHPCLSCPWPYRLCRQPAQASGHVLHPAGLCSPLGSTAGVRQKARRP
jgi:hypothetical protein